MIIPSLLIISALSQVTPPPVQTPTPTKGSVIAIPPAEDTVNRALSMEEAVRIALVQSPQIAAARFSVEAARGRLNAGAAGLGPQLSVSAGYQKQERSGDAVAGSRDEPVSATVRIQQLLFDFNRTRNQVRELGELADAAYFDFAALASLVRRDVGLAYTDLANTNQLVEIRNQDVAIRQAQLELAEARLEDRLGAPGDVVRARTSLASAMAALAQAEATRASNMARLAILMGIDPATPLIVEPPEDFMIIQVDVHSLVKMGMERRAELESQRRRVEGAEFALDAAQQGSSPSIFATASMSGSGRTDPTERRTTLYGVELSWPLFDSGLTNGRVQTARANRDQARADLIQTELEVSQQIIQAWLDYQSALEQARLQEIAVANAQESARIAQGRYSEGLGSFLEVTDAQAALLQAQLALSQARASLARARTTLDWAIGSDIPAPTEES